MKKLSLLLMMTLFCIGLVSAQRTVTGTITDDTGEPLIGATVLVKGMDGVGAASDIDGTYSLDVPDGGTTLVFSYTGFTDKEMEIGTSNVIDAILSEGLDLDEVVVTGLGIKKEKKALGYGVSTIGAENIAAAGETDLARILNGKATGVNIQQTSGLAGSGTNIIIRGYSSLTGSNQPLFVIDGVPFNTDTASDQGGFTQGSATASSRFLDLDPNNIAEVNILKGLSATVLYGEAGRNGVILVTTKTGSVDDDAPSKTSISVSQGINVSQISNLPDYQNIYGNGFSGNYGAFFSNWGPSFDVRGSNGVDENGTIPHPYDNGRNNSRIPEFIGQRYEYKPYESAENFFQDGTGYNTSINLSKNLGKASVSAAYSYVDENGFTPELGEMVQTIPGDLTSYEYQKNGTSSNNYTKHNMALGASATLDNGLRLGASFNYITSDRTTPPAGSGGFLSTTGSQAALFSDVLYTPRSVDLLHLPFEAPDGSMVYYRGGSPIQNPLWTLNNTGQVEDVDRFFGNVTASFDVTDWMSVQGRFGVDQFTQYNQFFVNKGGAQAPDGLYNTSTRVNRIYDHVLNLIFDKNINEDLNIDGLLGVNFRGERRDYQFAGSSEQFVRGLFNHGNFITQTTSSFIREEKTNGVYANVTLGYKSFLYATLAARNDWTSTLSPENRSVFYPSASISFIPSELFNNKYVNYLKVRVGYGQSAGYPDPYATSNVLGANPRAFQSAGGTLVRTNSVSNFLGNPNLVAEKVDEYELGIEGRFWENRIGIDLSLYRKESNDLLLDLSLDPSTGFTSTTTNIASVSNEGLEVGLNVNPFKGDFGWNSQFNFTTNKNIVESLAPGVDQFPFAGFTTLGNFGIPGETYGVIVGSAYEKNDAGELLVNSLGEYIEKEDIEVIGDPNPNFTYDWINTFNYKNVALNVQLSYVDGGDIYSATALTLLGRGNTTDTDFNRFLPIVLPGVLAADGTTPNNIQTYAGDAFFSAYGEANEGAIFDGTTLRLREVSLSYSIPEKALANTPFGGISIKFYGNNLWYKAFNFPEGLNFDPEVLSLGVGNGRGFDFLTGPTSRRFGAVVNVTF